MYETDHQTSTNWSDDHKAGQFWMREIFSLSVVLVTVVSAIILLWPLL